MAQRLWKTIPAVQGPPSPQRRSTSNKIVPLPFRSALAGKVKVMIPNPPPMADWVTTVIGLMVAREPVYEKLRADIISAVEAVKVMTMWSAKRVGWLSVTLSVT